MKVGITGGSGFIGKHLVDSLLSRGDEVAIFVREGSGMKPPNPAATIRAFPRDAAPDVEGLDAVVNLSGESILGRWTRAKKDRILGSRVNTTRRLVEAMKGAGKPRILVNASAVGFYGNGGDTVLDEEQPAGDGFLSEICEQWEAAATLARENGVRVACVRIGFVLGRDGGAFPPLRSVFNLGLGGRLGDGSQWMPPVHVDDVVGLMGFLLDRANAEGAFNAVCAEPVRNVHFTRAVAHALKRPAFLPAPAFALKALLGEASQLMLNSVRAIPSRALAAGYVFRFPTLETMLEDVCGS